jgi:uncharacterized membrane protein YfcA
MVLPLLLLAAAGLFAGILTTIAGMGGGLLLVLALSLVWGPGPALASTAVALLVGNIHRVSLFWGKVDRRIVGAFAVGAVPGALVGALFVVAVPERVVHVVMALLTALAVLRAMNRLPWEPKPSHLMPGGALIGTLTGAAGGAGVLAGPLFLAAGLEGEAYVASTSASAALMHAARVAGYGAGGLFTEEVAAYAAVLAVSIVTGNFAGKRLRAATERAPARSIETATLVVCVGLAIAGVAR